MAVVHPLSSAGSFSGREATAPFVFAGSYLDVGPVAWVSDQGGIEMTFITSIARWTPTRGRCLLTGCRNGVTVDVWSATFMVAGGGVCRSAAGGKGGDAGHG
jgi:hypothetical protein